MTKGGGSVTPVLIAGGGIGGLAAAYALAQVGRPSHVLEQGKEFGEVGAGIQLGPNVFKMFDRMGLTDAITDVAFLPDNLIMRDGLTGQEITRLPVGSAAFLERFKYPYQERYLRTARVQLYARMYGEFYHAGGVRAEVRNELLKPKPGGGAPGEGMAWLYDGIQA